MVAQPELRTDLSPVLCARCAAELHLGTGDSYRVTIEAVADPAPPRLETDLSPEELRRQIEQTIAQLARLSEREALDEVHRRQVLYLCGPCYRLWIEDPTGRVE